MSVHVGDVFDALRSPGPATRQGVSDLYDGVIGAWDAEAIDHLDDGTQRRQSADILFGWVLEGRAIQDTWIVPSLRDRGTVAASSPGNRYGTTLRVYDPRLDAWRITWINPVNGTEMRLVGRRVGSQIVQTGADPDGRLVRWRFVDITEESFHWIGEVSEDGGSSWVIKTEFVARRKDGTCNQFVADTGAGS